jgi:HTH-type transcriptional regulator/antitoxin HigA
MQDILRPIRSEFDYEESLRVADSLMDAEPGTPESDRLEVLAALIEDYEEKNFPIDAPDPIEAIKFRMEQRGLRPVDIQCFIGSRGRVTEVLNHQRALTLAMIRRLSSGLNIPASILIKESHLVKRRTRKTKNLAKPARKFGVRRPTVSRKARAR